jgi:ectoine hydroxylase-related dioxygenase (phytanoyl-CoA dioxygenase family)
VARSPKPVKDVAQARRDLGEFGYCILAHVLTPAEVRQLRELVLAELATDEAIDASLVQGFFGDPDDRNRRLWRLPPRHKAFQDLVEHPVVLKFAEDFLGPSIIQESILCQNLSANITRPGSQAMGIHADLGFMRSPWPTEPVMIQFAWAIDDYTVENGATRFVPGSHLAGHSPDPSEPHYSEAAVAPAGSVIVWDARTWHHTGANVTADKSRIGIICGYTQPWVRTQVNWSAVIPLEEQKTLSPRLYDLFGLGPSSVGWLDVHRLYSERQAASAERSGKPR